MLFGTNEKQTEGSSVLRHSSRVFRRADPGLFVRRIAAFVAILSCTFFTRSASADQHDAKSILILYSFSRGAIGSEESLESALRRDIPWQLNFGVEFLESRRFLDEGYEDSVVETLQHTYGGQKFDLIIAVSYPALEFAVKHRNELFPGVPIVFFEVDTRRLAERELWPGVTGVLETVPVQETIDLAFHLHPETSTVAIITNVSSFENFWLAELHTELAHSREHVRVIDLVSLPATKIFERVSALPPHSLVFFQRAPQTGIQPAIGDYEMLAWVGQHVPTYCIFPEICLGHGGIGGAEAEAAPSMAAELARRVLSGERPDDIPVITDPSYQVQVDWRQLRSWQIPESALPPGSLVLYREPTFWERDRKYIVPIIAVILTQALLIAGLLWQRTRKRKAEAILRESEDRFRQMADTTPSLIWMCDAQGKVTYLNERWLAFAGPASRAGYGDSWITSIHPDDVQQVLDSLWKALKGQKPFSKEYRLRRNDGAYRWMFDVASPRVNGDGSIAGFIGSAIDVTDQKLAQQALEQVSGRLIEAQEKERTRIARDLHDDICQRLALLSMELEQAKAASSGRVSATKSLEEIRQHCSEIAGDVQSLSHQLHSSKLDYLGIAAAIRGFCKEFSKQHRVIVDFTDSNVPRRMRRDVSLCVFRVAQEALQNAVKYSGANQFRVDLRATANEMRLQVTDSGLGFEVGKPKKTRGLGLVSMQERVHLVNGRFDVESKPGKGTSITAVVPIVAEEETSIEDTPARQAAGKAEIR